MTAPSSTRARLKLVARITLLALTLAALAWVITPLITQWDQVRPLLSRPDLALGLLAGSLIYAALLWLLMAPGWWWLTRLYGRTAPPLATAAVWCRTQIVKYLPGNIAHYAGRQVVGSRLGLRQVEMAGASVLELGSILAASGLIGVSGLVLGFWSVAGPADAATAGTAAGMPAASRLAAASTALIAFIVLGFLGWPIADALLRRLPWTRSRMSEVPKIAGWPLVRAFAPAMLIHTIFLIATGLLLWWLVVAATPAGASPPPALRIIWIYAVAWAVGTVTPGAPAGAGVREAILTYELAADLGRPEAAAIALALRLLTTAGDVLAFAASYAVNLRPRPGSTHLSERAAQASA